MNNAENSGGEWLARGLKFYGGINCRRDILSASDCFKRAAKADRNLKSKCLYYLGLCYLCDGYKDLDRAESSLKAAARCGDRDALRRLGLLYLEEGAYPRPSKAAAAFKKAALNGDEKSKFYYGLLLQTGRGSKRDEFAAYRLFCEGAASGDNDCLTEKGRALLLGMGVDKDLDAAEKALRSAAERGSLTALALTGVLLQTRAEQENAAAQLSADSCDDNGNNRPPAATEKADTKRIRAADGNGENACSKNGKCADAVSSEVGGKLKEAVQIYIEAAQGGDAEGLYRLALCYYEGIAVKRDVKKAAAFFEEAARKKHPKAMERTACLYGRGEGVPLDYAKARDGFAAACLAGEDCRDKARLMAKYLRRAKTGYAEYYRMPLEYERGGYFIEDDVLVKYNGGPDCRVPEGVKKIAAGAFTGRLKKVTLPSTLVKVDANAFSGAQVGEFSAPRDCLAVRVREGRLYDKKGVKLG